MNEKQIPLTPAEQMQRIRNAVLAAETPKDAEAILAACLSQLDTLRDHIADLEGEMALQEQPFVSRAPLIGPAIVWFRSLWNWMSTKWYVLPLVAQQNAFNAATVQTLREIATSVESLASLVYALQTRVAGPEASAPPRAQESPEQN